MSKKGLIAAAFVVALLAGVIFMGPVASQTPTPSPSGSGSQSASPSSSPSSSPSDPDHITITRLDPGDDDRQLPIVHAGKRPRGFSKGDIVTFRTPLLDPTTREKDGRLTAQCTVLVSKQTKVGFLCHAEAIFDEGRLTGFGTVTFGENQPPSVLAITGGTGDYEHARGEVTVSESPNLTTFEVHLE